MSDIETVEFAIGQGVLVETLGSKAILTAPHAEDAVIVEIGGRVNKTHRHKLETFLLAPGQAAELIAAMILSGARFSTLDHFMADVADNVKRLLREGER